MTLTRPMIEIVRSSNPVADDVRARLLDRPAFGRVFTDHMATATWTSAAGWHAVKVGERKPLLLDPAAGVLHYAQEIFEGMKAYRGHDGLLNLFRPEQNARRFNSSARRMAMPEMPEELFLGAVEALVKIDQGWIPGGDGSLYLRPFMFASEAFLGVRPSAEYIFCIIASPVGNYFSRGKKSITLWVSDHLNRAGPGGTGAAKCGGNYAASLLAQVEAQDEGCDQVVFLDAVEHRWVDELGGMNLFFVFADGRVTTPPLSGTILPGITRASILELLTHQKVVVSELPYAIDQWRADAESGHLQEVFACGTAAVVSAVGEIRSKAGAWTIGNGAEGELTASIKAKLVGMQRGEISAPQGWLQQLDPSSPIGDEG